MTRECSNLKVKKTSTQKNEKVTLAVVIITLVMMVAEIVGGLITGSMALLSDGIHMGTHALALFITLAAYIFARRHKSNPAFSFGTGKVGILGAYTNAILLIIAGFAMAYESIERLLDPVEIQFNEAIIVAVIGLIVNVVCALILGHGEDSHGHDHDHDHGQAHSDQNLRAAYLHVLTDAMTSILAIFALVVGKMYGLVWADPIVGILGALVITKWAIGLIRQSGSILLDLGDFSPEIQTIKQKLEQEGTIVKDLHIWQISENERSLIVSLETKQYREPQYFHDFIEEFVSFEHVTVEVNCPDEGRVKSEIGPNIANAGFIV